jgi:UDP-N-acetyl-2-amino-2-deoxyglucuronate dehydrogenase
MNRKKIRIAVIGAGAVTPHHINAWQQIPRAEVVAICRRDVANDRQLASRFNLFSTTDYNDLLNDPDIDAVDITLPSGLHAEFGIKAAEAGKHIIVEKPIDVSIKKADALIEACDRAGVTLAVISQYRFMDPVLRMYDIVKKGQLGDLLQGDAYIKWYRSQEYYDSGAWRGTWELDGGGPFMNQGIHFIDLLLSVMGPVKWVFAKTRTTIHNIEVEDIGMAMMEFDSGAFGVIQASTAVFPGLPARLEIHGTDGTISIEGEKLGFLHIKGQKPEKGRDIAASGAASPMSIDVTPFVREFDDIISAITHRRAPLVSGTEARRSLQLILAIYESAKTGRPVAPGV